MWFRLNVMLGTVGQDVCGVEPILVSPVTIARFRLNSMQRQMLASFDGGRDAVVHERGPIDREHLARYTLGEPTLEREVLALFAGQAEIHLTALKRATTDTAWYEAAHTIKGSARAIGAWRVADCALAAEMLKLGCDLARRDALLEGIADTLAEACRYIADLDRRPA